ncbi:hypothetical protein O0I10_004306 [Lichtheimia ornata]|uniref:Nucleolar protein 12 n=1 Tax=Lichtheimia ornata TaxID=688661 RepID=A0AAD7V8W9_9FUNG|nr:uncharacterized protein O0I10_004306 [Lichtheimia ornata]KAJ8660077.1 hypothetical protein O0I10_004306 [Lichtheimia ornata]
MPPKISNTEILTAGAKAYAKKRRKKEKVVESIEFDPASRKDFLTGFRKRKQERKRKAKEKYDERLRQEKIKDRAILRAERRREVEEKMAALQAMIKGEHPSEDEEEITLFGKDDDTPDASEEKQKESNVTEFKSNTALTTVTVIEEMDDWGKDI